MTIEHPGRQLQRLIDEYMLTRDDLANYLGVDTFRLYKILKGDSGISHEMALLLGQVFCTAQFWAHAQCMFELAQAHAKLKAEGRLPILRRLQRPTDVTTPTIFDQCLCNHWGWEHIDYPDGGCSATKEDGTPCTCPMYLRLGGYIATIEAERNKELDEEARNAANRNNGGVP